MNAHEEREMLVVESVHSALLEGLNVSSAFRRDSDDCVAGTMSAEELAEMTRKRLGLP